MKSKPIIAGLFWHVHHQDLVEFCYDVQERREYIKYNKDDEEIPLRLKLLKPVRNLSPELKELVRSCKHARVYDYSNYGYCMDKLKLWIYRNLTIINRLHKSQCKHCPWDGSNILTRWDRDKHQFVMKNQKGKKV